MNTISNISEVLTYNDILSSFSYNIKNSLYNILMKLNYTTKNEILSPDNIIKVFNNESQNITLPSSIYSSYDTLLDITNFLPVKFKVTLVGNNIYFHLKDRYIKVSEDKYKLILSNRNSFITKKDNNLLYNKDDLCGGKECFILHTKINIMHVLNIKMEDFDTQHLDLDNNIIVYIEVPIIYKDLILSKITGYDGYITSKTYYKTFLNKNFIFDIVNKPIEKIINNKNRDIVFDIQKLCNNRNLNNQEDFSFCYKKIFKIFTSEYRKLDYNEIINDYPELHGLVNNNKFDTITIMLNANVNNININDNTDFPIINTLLNKLKNNLS